MAMEQIAVASYSPEAAGDDEVDLTLALAIGGRRRRRGRRWLGSGEFCRWKGMDGPEEESPPPVRTSPPATATAAAEHQKDALLVLRRHSAGGGPSSGSPGDLVVSGTGEPVRYAPPPPLPQVPPITITGLLVLRYREAEVSIVCVCHGSSFSPAGFVRHAGGSDLSNPLRQITVFSS
ncbi:unnamed protein product [Spirodela intermedia]|uniref:Ninja-family protein n=1 Tax=Spirodela intermedia TaxID=51605 RepID=A0A7I8JDT9_SPIIN|nr:unnamed protein product [Spirodela intermedia]CAA6667915.1 unnamed protein product [Spirodela intermedia]